MFYDAFAAMIGQSGDALASRDRGPADDPRFLREGRQIATFLRRTEAVWPDLFHTLASEIEALEQGLARVNATFSRQGIEALRLADTHGPLERYRELNRALDRAIQRLIEFEGESWAVAALGDLRRTLALAAEIQGHLVDRMLEVR